MSRAAQDQLRKGQHAGELTGSLDSLLREGINGGSLVALGVDELVVEDLDLGVLGGQANDLVGNGLGVGKGRNILAYTGEGELDVLGLGTLQLGLALLAYDDEVVAIGLLGEGTTDITGQAGVNTTTKALVRRADNQQSLLVLALEGLGLGLGEDFVGGLAVVLGLGHGALGAGQLGRGDNLHGFGDLLDVADGLETALDFTEGREAGGGIGGGGDGAVRIGSDGLAAGQDRLDTCPTHSSFIDSSTHPFPGSGSQGDVAAGGSPRTERELLQLSEPVAQLWTASCRRCVNEGCSARCGSTEQ